MSEDYLFPKKKHTFTISFRWKTGVIRYELKIVQFGQKLPDLAKKIF